MPDSIGTDSNNDVLQEQIKNLYTKIDHLQIVLNWYADQARARAKNGQVLIRKRNSSKSQSHAAVNALMETVSLLAFDNSKYADEALKINV